MRRQIFFIICVAALSCAWAQKGEKKPIYLNKFLEHCKRGEASYIMEVVKDLDTVYFVQVKNMKGGLKMEGYYTDEALTTEHGQFTYYYKNGQVESRGNFSMGSKSGLWLRFHQDGRSKAERLYDTEVLATVVYTNAEKMPKYPGGEAAVQQYFSQHLRSLAKNGGSLKTSFIVETDGDLSQVQIMDGVSADVDREAQRLLGDMPRWQPGMDKGRAVRVQMIFPIEF